MTVIKGPPALDGPRSSVCRQMLGPHNKFYIQRRQKQPPGQGGRFVHWAFMSRGRDTRPRGPPAPPRPAHARTYMRTRWPLYINPRYVQGCVSVRTLNARAEQECCGRERDALAAH